MYSSISSLVAQSACAPALSDPGHELVRVGDVVRASPVGEFMKFEGVAVEVSRDHITVDFGDNEDAVQVPIAHCAKVKSGTTLEVDDIVQVKPNDFPVFCLGKIQKINNDGTYDVCFDGTDEIELSVNLSCIRKVNSARISGMKKVKKVVKAIGAARAFVGAGAVWGGAAERQEAKGDETENGQEDGKASAGEEKEAKE